MIRGLLGRMAPLVLVAASIVACTTMSDGRRATEPPPEVTATMPLDKALTVAVDHGGESLERVKRLIKQRNEAAKAHAMIAAMLAQYHGSYQQHQMINAVHLYMAMPGPLSLPLWRELVRSPQPLSAQLGWQLAASKASPEVARAIDNELGRAIAENEEESVLHPQMANALAANRMRSSYTLARQGLMRKGSEEFARAMIVLEPARASRDFLPYLAQAGAEELRQLTLSSVNLYTSILILKHLQRVPPDISAPHFDHLFFYAVSRNVGLAEQTQAVLERYLPQKSEALAAMLARHPVWVQMSYLENARRRTSPTTALFLGELKKVTAEDDVAREIGEQSL